ncbi:MAG: SET domain-containing protein-lysine N-methyltransferase [Nanoarchaeota archaeon]|nr:SET domain-containing protein-lysine N-methyltransferase [Nanoarchaeota archaeon]
MSKQQLVNQELFDVKNSKIHGNGIYASIDIKKGTKIIEYVGNKVTKEEADIVSDRQLELAKGNKGIGEVYLFELNDTHDIDGNVGWNPARFINHSCEPNCEVEIENDKIWIVALKDIKKGKELSYDYGYDAEDFKDHKCKCGSENCFGYIVGEDYREDAKKKLAEVKK